MSGKAAGRQAVPLSGSPYDFEQEASATHFYPLRFFGMGLFIAWLSCTHVSLVFPGPGIDLAGRDAFDIGMRFGDIGTFVVLALAARRIGSVTSHKVACGIFVGLCAAGTAFCGLVAIPGGYPLAATFCMAVVTAIGGALLFCLWSHIYCSMGITQTIVAGAYSCLTALGAACVVGMMRPPFAILVTAALPVLSLVAGLMCLNVLPQRKQVPVSGDAREAMPRRLLAIMALGSVIMGCSGAFMTTTSYMGSIHRVLATGVFGAVILGLVRMRETNLDARELARTALPLALTGLALVPFASGLLGEAVSFLLKLSFVFFTFFVLLVMVRIVQRHRIPTLRLFAVTRACTELPILAGLLLQRHLLSTGLVEDITVRVGFSLGGIVLVLLCVVLWKSEPVDKARWYIQSIELASNPGQAGSGDYWQERGAAVARRHGLTAREVELLTLSLQGKTRSEIEQELFLSANTVKTHLRHAYGKLGVHSKAEAAEVFERAL